MDVISLMNAIEQKIRRITPYLCNVMQISYKKDVLNQTPVQITMETLDGVTEIKSAVMFLDEDSKIIAHNGTLECIYNEYGSDADRVVFKEFSSWEEFLKDEVSL